MPNYVRNIVRVYPGSATYDKVLSVLQNGHKLFDSFFPTPEALLDGEGWYGWRLRYWGTKWDAIDPYVIEDSDDMLEFQFETAWTAPMNFWARLADHDRELKLDACYADEDIGSNCGKYHVADGVLVKEKRSGDDVFANRVWKNTDVEEFDLIWEEN